MKSMTNKMKWGLLTVLFFGLTLASCEPYPGEDDYVTDQLSAFTAYDPAANFSKYSTYSLGETLAVVNDNDTVKVPWNRDSNTQALHDQIQANIEKYLGYSEDDLTPDIGVLVSVVERDNYIVSYNPWWWGYCDWYFWWPCGYYPYYPYPYPVIVGSYTVGTTNINMADLTNVGLLSNQQINILWTGIIRSLLTGTQTQTDFNNAIEDCFRQTKAFQ